LRTFGRFAHLLLGCVWFSDPQIFNNRTVEQQRFLKHHANIPAQPGQLEFANIDPIDLDHARLRIEGAVSNATGRIDITSMVDEKAQRFKLTWTEKGGPAVQKPTRRSFGTRLIGSLADQLHGDVRLRYEPAGVVYELDIPLAILRALRANWDKVCLDHIVVLSEAHLRRILRSYARYYNDIRTHRSVDKDAPVSRPVQRTGVISSHAVLGGLHHRYVRV
jgi:hypothetical protein